MKIRPSPIFQIHEREARQKLSRLNQEHLFQKWETLNIFEKEQLLSHIAQIDESFFKRQQEALKKNILTETQDRIEPIDHYEVCGSLSDLELGKQALSQGKCAALVVAGGQGSRLRFDGPKGCFPVSVVKKKSLFQLLAEKVKAASKRAQYPLEIAIMTSPLNHVETELFFDQHAFFGLKPNQVHFFPQQVWPLLDLQSNLFLESPSQLALGPNGNGGALRLLMRSGIGSAWQTKGIEMVSFIPIDNALADPFDAELLGFHLRTQNSVSIKGMLRSDPEEKVGVLIQKNKKIEVCEYSELPKDVRTAKKEGKRLLYPLANLSLFCFGMDFIQNIQAKELPLHLARKAVKRMNEDGGIVFPQEPNAWKFEEFIFDVLPFAAKVETLVYPRSDCFAPLKNFSGEDSIEKVQEALQAADRKAFFQVTGFLPDSQKPFELAQEFHYPTDTLLQKWRGRSESLDGYIEA